MADNYNQNQNYNNDEMANQYQSPQMNNQPQKRSLVLSMVALIFGIVSILFSVVLLGLICGITAVTLGCISLRKQLGGQGMAIAAIICGIIEILLFVLY